MQTPRLIAAATVTAMLTAASASAQALDDFRIDSGFSTMGLYLAPDMALGGPLRLRVPVYFAGMDEEFEIEGNITPGSLDVRSVALVGDYYLGGSGFRLSGGLAFGGYELSGQFTDMWLGGTRHLGTVDMVLAQKNDFAAVLALGYHHSFGEHWGVSAEIGTRFTSLELSPSGTVSNPAHFQSEIDRLNDDLDTGFLPFLSFGTTYRF